MASSVAIWNFNVSQVYDPSIQGTIDSIDYFEDAIQFSCVPCLPLTIPGTPLLSAIALRQSNVLYLRTPDFSATGSPIEFGFVRLQGNRTFGSEFEILLDAFEIRHGIDNWRVELHTVPEAPGLVLRMLVMSRLALGRARPRRLAQRVRLPPSG